MKFKCLNSPRAGSDPPLQPYLPPFLAALNSGFLRMSPSPCPGPLHIPISVRSTPPCPGSFHGEYFLILRVSVWDRFLQEASPDRYQLGAHLSTQAFAHTYYGP